MNNLLFNPFERFSETRLLSSGLAGAIAGSFIAFYCGGRYDGVIDFHLSNNIKLIETLTDNGINTLSLFVLLFIVGKIVNRKTRIVDILSVSLIARFPFYMLPLFNSGGFLSSAMAGIDPVNPAAMSFTVTETIVLVLFSIVAILCLVWFVVLLYNGFRVATNAKTVPHKVLFAVALILAEILSKYIFTLTI